MKIDHEMHLNENPFFLIKSGKQKVEGRICDEKRACMKVGEIIRFYLRPKDDSFFDVRIVDIKKYPDFEKMFLDLGADSFGRNEDCTLEEFIFSYRKYYSEEEEKKFGVLGIVLEVLE